MNILVVGSKGWIGKQFIQILEKENITFIESKSRADNYKEIEEEILLEKPTHIISFIGRTHGKIEDKEYTTIDFLEQKGKLFENTRDNLYSPIILSELSIKHNIHYTYLGTGCIFTYNDGYFEKEENGFTEDSEPNFFGSSYSIIKGFTDRFMRLKDKSVLNLRIRMPITGEYSSRNFITKITTYEKICSIANSMTVLPELLPIVLDMIKNNTTGTINLTNPGFITHNEILEMYKEIVNPEFTWNNFTLEEQSKVIASDRSNNYLDTTKLQKMYPSVKHIKDSVKDCLIKYKETLVNKH